MPENIQVISHPLVQHKLSLMRKKSTSTQSFRTLIPGGRYFAGLRSDQGLAAHL